MGAANSEAHAQNIVPLVDPIWTTDRAGNACRQAAGQQLDPRTVQHRLDVPVCVKWSCCLHLHFIGSRSQASDWAATDTGYIIDGLFSIKANETNSFGHCGSICVHMCSIKTNETNAFGPIWQPFQLFLDLLPQSHKR